MIEKIFVFCCVWSFGCTGDYASRKKFDTKIREMS